MRRSRKRILVVGGSGFLGPSLVSQMLSAGHVVAVLNRGTRRVPGTTQLVADRNSFSQMRALAVNSVRYDAVVDLSCYTLAQAKLVFACLGRSAGQWIHLSTAAVYEPLARPSEESDIAIGNPAWGTYGTEKAAVDAWYREQRSGTAVTIVRPPFIYGEVHPRTHEAFVWRRLLTGRPVLLPGDGSAPVQFLHVRDFVECMLSLIKRDVPVTEVYNVGPPHLTTLLAFVEACASAAGVRAHTKLSENSRFEAAPCAPYPAPDTSVNISSYKIQSHLGWVATTKLQEALNEEFNEFDRRVARTLESAVTNATR